MERLRNKNILVVGGSRGIGAAVVRRIRDEGGRPLVWSRRPPDESSGIFGVDHAVLDVSEPEDRWNVETPEQLDGLVYCPGSITLASFPKLDDDTFLRDFEINVLGAVRVLRRTIRALSQASGSVVLFSTVAVGTGLSFHASIAAAKGALEGMARSLAAEYAAKGLRVNVIAPSLTDTDLASGLLSSEKRREASKDRHPIKAVGRPDQVAGAVIHLLSDDAAWTSGTVLNMDGGLGSLRP